MNLYQIMVPGEDDIRPDYIRRLMTTRILFTSIALGTINGLTIATLFTFLNLPNIINRITGYEMFYTDYWFNHCPNPMKKIIIIGSALLAVFYSRLRREIKRHWG